MFVISTEETERNETRLADEAGGEIFSIEEEILRLPDLPIRQALLFTQNDDFVI